MFKNAKRYDCQSGECGFHCAHESLAQLEHHQQNHERAEDSRKVQSIEMNSEYFVQRCIQIWRERAIEKIHFRVKGFSIQQPQREDAE